MQEKKINKKIYRERERERKKSLFVRENYVKNGRKNKKFIVNGVNKKIQNKGR